MGRFPSATIAILAPTARAVTPDDAAYLADVTREIRDVFASAHGGDTDTAADVLNRLLRTTGARPQLDRAANEPWQLHFHGADDTLAIGWSASCVTAPPGGSVFARPMRATACTSTPHATPVGSFVVPPARIA